MSPLPPSPEAVSIVSMVRAHRRAILLTQDGPSPRPTVIDPASGALIAPLADHETQLDTATLFIPDESAGSVQLLVLPSQSPPASDADTDRYRAAHGTPDPISLFRLKLDGARFGSAVIDASDLDLRDPFLTESGAIRRALNADRDALTRACMHVNLGLGARPGETVVALSVDPEGIDIKGPIGIGRYHFGVIAKDREHLRSLAAPLLPFDPNMTRV